MLLCRLSLRVPHVVLAYVLLMQPAGAQIPGLPFLTPAEPPCVVWGPAEQAGGKQVCRRRAVRPSEALISCRLFSSPVDTETGNKMCTYRRPGLSPDDKVVPVPIGTPCAATLMC
jgi:hypothetical protein